jgi:DNA-binding MarR family transcriptional regulator
MLTEYDSIGKWISVIHRQFQNYINHELKERDLNASQFIYLINLFQEDGISQETLTSKMYIDKSMTARSLKQLEKTGYIRREKSKTDGRAYEVFTTQKARNLRPEADRILIEWNKLLAENINDQEIVSLIHVLKEMSDSVLTRQKGIPEATSKKKRKKEKLHEKKSKHRQKI